ncbi:bifunctional phosphopantothenoylcysteine decarboxylase/phosphopantothenate synthase [Oceaniovalibus guishaninsula JLT2003]|uniref:Coenzyme A biosynthesis bifunctional protein CoaBC n=1 Tax=Oceaniovalibus guishaninsula JLT2003 TaxID=1231392 RepID=K2HB28_9RHOB|nr:bifunctional phosphopantothenoylcysteine decarboxylase/phosphopantothenate--cysteine ligase CoaBC [Oceaniovalibus guishaninsula]EKE43872.1 bifunctional phosphopantothenoylcysteine decarboxylase/phosphopantothenate synthase [Oceaniovalibus guishaninsula JLT2003]
MLNRHILLIVSGGIAAYKALELVRRLRERGASVTPVMTRAAAQFVTPLSLSALAGVRVHTDLWDLTAEAEMGHIQLSRVADLIVVAPATADLMARAAQGRADDLASTLLLATDTPVLMAPAMNVRMWTHPATTRNLATLRADGIRFVGPDEGDMACGEYGPGRMAEVPAILTAIDAQFAAPRLRGLHALVTSGPTHEPIDPVRYIANRSSGAQGTAIAAALHRLGARVTFVTGPATTPPPPGPAVIRVETAAEMHAAVKAALPADIAVFAAAVADWRIANAASSKMKKGAGRPELSLTQNPDILADIAGMTEGRPSLVVGFAAETDDVLANARAKLARKGCDWIVANDVSPATGIMGGAENAVTLVTSDGAEDWPRASKEAVADRLAHRIAEALARDTAR